MTDLILIRTGWFGVLPTSLHSINGENLTEKTGPTVDFLRIFIDIFEYRRELFHCIGFLNEADRSFRDEVLYRF